MITGFNTDVRHGNVVFHVQTEDKGTGNPCIESLVYVGGQILARKRAGYRSLLDEAEASKAVAELMERQHRSMIQQIRAGEMDEKVAAIKGAAPGQTARPAAEPVSNQVKPPSAARPAAPPDAPSPSARPSAPPLEPPRPARSAPSAAQPAASAAAPASTETPAPTAMPPQPTEPEVKPQPAAPSRAKRVPPAVLRPVPPAPPRPAPSAPRRPPPPVAARPQPAAEEGDRTLDQVILDYLEMESDQERLVLTMNRRDGELEAGAEATLLFRTESSVDRDPIGQVQITVRLISTIGEPQVLARGRTDDRGELALKINIPELQAGTGALIVSAESSIGNAESRHLI